MKRTIKRRRFETVGFRTIELVRGQVLFPDGRHCRFNVRLVADPGELGAVRLVVEDINLPTDSATSRKLTRRKTL